MSSTSIMTDEVSSLKSLVSTKLWLQSNLCQARRALLQSEWKNERAKNNNAYVPTMKEHVANIITHGVTHNIHQRSKLSLYHPRSW